MQRSNKNTRHGLVAALEAEELEAARMVEEQNALVGDNAESVETEMLEMAEMDAEDEQACQEFEEGTEVVEALESIRDAMGISAANGGMDKHSANVVSIAVEHLYNRIGVSAKAMPAMESFGQTQSRASATTLAMEGMSEQIKKVWQAIVAALKKAAAWIVTYYNQVFDVATKQSERAKSMQAKLKDIKGEAKEKSFENQKLANSLKIGDAVPGSYKAVISSFSKVASEVFGSTEENLNWSGIISDALGKPEAVKSFIDNFSFETPTSYAKEISNPESMGFEKPAEGMVVSRTEELPGGKAVVFVGVKGKADKEEGIKALEHVKAMVSEFDPKATGEAKPAVPTLSLDDAKAIVDTLVEITATVLKFKASATKIAAAKKDFAAAVEKATSAIEKADDSAETKANVAAMKTVATKYGQFLDNPAKDFARYTLGTTKSLLDYVELSLKQYGSAT